MAEVKINAKGLQCPGPIVQLFTEIKKLNSGDIIEIEATDHGFVKDVAAWCKKTGNKLLSLIEQDNIIAARIEKA
jgi:tRNA 2-thiouridine synthesizing protein A